MSLTMTATTATIAVTSLPLIFITGASSGIGQALALRYYQAGWRVALVARRGQLMQAWAEGQGWALARYQIYAADVAQIDSISAAASACLTQQGVPDVVVANAGISIGVDGGEREDLDVLSQIFATNNVGLAATFQPFIRPMQARGRGCLVGIASVGAIRGMPSHGAYCASKAAVVAQCESLRGDLARSGVQVLTLLPGYIATPLTSKNRFPMPFLISAKRFADLAYRQITVGNTYAVIPWQMGVVVKLLRLLPNAWFDKLFANQPRKQRKAELLG
jgi:short-subunit dehydrogenase